MKCLAVPSILKPRCTAKAARPTSQKNRDRVLRNLQSVDPGTALQCSLLPHFPHACTRSEYLIQLFQEGFELIFTLTL